MSATSSDACGATSPVTGGRLPSAEACVRTEGSSRSVDGATSSGGERFTTVTGSNRGAAGWGGRRSSASRVPADGGAIEVRRRCTDFDPGGAIEGRRLVPARLGRSPLSRRGRFFEPRDERAASSKSTGISLSCSMPKDPPSALFIEPPRVCAECSREGLGGPSQMRPFTSIASGTGNDPIGCGAGRAALR